MTSFQQTVSIADLYTGMKIKLSGIYKFGEWKMKGCNEKTMKKNMSFVKAVRMREILNFPSCMCLVVLNLTCMQPLLVRVLDLSLRWKIQKSVDSRRRTVVFLKNSLGSLWFCHTLSFLDVCCGPGLLMSRLAFVCQGSHTCGNQLPCCAELEWALWW